MRIAYNNYVDTADSITASSEDSSYPIENVQDQRLSYKYKSTVCSAVSITINLTSFSEATISTLALLGHNLSSSASIIVDFNNSDSWPGDIQETLTWNEGIILKFLTDTIDTDADYITTETGDFLITEDSKYLISSYGFNYMQIRITDPTNTDGHIELGRIWIGDYLTISPSSLLDFKVIKKRSDINIYGKDRQKFSIPGVGWRRIELSFPMTENNMIESIISLYKTVANNKSFIFCNFDTIRNYKIVEPMYCSIDGELSFTHGNNMKFSYSLNLEEDL